MSENKKSTSLFLSAAVSYFIGWLWICCFLMDFRNSLAEKSIDLIGSSWYPLLFSLLFFLWAGWTLHGKMRASRESFFWLGCSLLITLAIGLRRARAADIWAYPALHVFAAYWVICRAGLLTDAETGKYYPLDLLDAFVLSPFGGFFLRIVTLFRSIPAFLSGHTSEKPRIDRRTAGISVLIVFTGLPLFLLAGNLLGQADPAFRHILDRFRLGSLHLPEWMPDFAVRFIWGLPVGAYLFGLVGSSLQRSTPRFQSGQLQSALEKMRIAPVSPLLLVMSAFSGLYLLFFAVQASHLLGAFAGIVPGQFTAAQYAREGFFQLCAVMVINFALLAAAAIISRTSLQQHKPLRRLSEGILIESIFLAVTAASKLWLYIHRFGFTPLRLLSAWGILVLSAAAILALLSLHKRCHAAKKWILFAAASFTLLCFY